MIRRDFAHLPKTILVNGHVIIAICAAFLLYLYSRDKNGVQVSALKKQLEQIEMTIDQEQSRFKDLDLALKSQSDPEYVELILKTKLGVKKRGEEKVVFITSDEKG